jgi:hypothetical protein
VGSTGPSPTNAKAKADDGKGQGEHATHLSNETLRHTDGLT